MSKRCYVLAALVGLVSASPALSQWEIRVEIRPAIRYHEVKTNGGGFYPPPSVFEQPRMPYAPTDFNGHGSQPFHFQPPQRHEIDFRMRIQFRPPPSPCPSIDRWGGYQPGATAHPGTRAKRSRGGRRSTWYPPLADMTIAGRPAGRAELVAELVAELLGDQLGGAVQIAGIGTNHSPRRLCAATGSAMGTPKRKAMAQQQCRRTVLGWLIGAVAGVLGLGAEARARSRPSTIPDTIARVAARANDCRGPDGRRPALSPLRVNVVVALTALALPPAAGRPRSSGNCCCPFYPRSRIKGT